MWMSVPFRGSFGEVLLDHMLAKHWLHSGWLVTLCNMDVNFLADFC